VFHDHCIESLKVSQEEFGDVAARCPLCRSLVDGFSSRLVRWRRAYKAQVFRWYPIYPTWTRADEFVLYAFVMSELKECGVEAADMGLETHHKEFLCSATEAFCGIPIKKYLGME
jgi:hypothetical protein